MRLREVLSGLSFCATALLLASAPLPAYAHRVDVTRPCTRVGTAGDDLLLGTPARDVLCGRGGDDVLAGLGGGDILRGGAGKDRIEGGGGSDLMFGGPGKDALYGYDGVHDHLIGGLGVDRARGDRLLDLVRAEARA